MSESDEMVKYELEIDGNESELPSSSSNEIPNWIPQMLDSATEFDPSGVDAFEQMQMLHNLSDELEFDGGAQWSPSEEQIRILEMLYNGGIGGVRSPTVQEIEQITSQLINFGKVEVTDVYLWFQARKDPERQKKTLRFLSPTGTEGSEITEPPASPEISKLGGKGKALSVEERSGLEKVVDMSSKMFGLASREKEGSDNSSRYDSTGKLLPIDSEKQRELIPTVEENIDVRANIIFLDRDFLEEADPQIPSQQDPCLPTVSSSTSSNREEESRPEGQNNKTADPKKPRWFHLFPWWQKK